MGLITAKELAKAAHLDRFGVVGTFAGWGLLHLLRLAPLNRVYDRNKHLQGVAFLEALLQEFKVHYDVREEDLKKIPKEGPFITISTIHWEGWMGFFCYDFSWNNVLTIR